MKTAFGLFFVIACIVTGYLIVGGHLHVLWQPAEYIIILGSGIGAFVIANPIEVVKGVGKSFGEIFKGNKLGKKEYMELLCLLFSLFKIARTKGMLSLESHIEDPYSSAIFQKFPIFLENKRAVTFLCDYLRMISMGSENVHQMEDLMVEEIEVYEHCVLEPAHALTIMADGLPALGIVAAVLGVIHTMGSISQPPEILGHLIGAALVGTFAGVLFSYGFVGPMASFLKVIGVIKVNYMNTLKSALVAYLQGNAPLLAVEQARKSADEHYRPSFTELEQQIQQIGEISA